MTLEENIRKRNIQTKIHKLVTHPPNLPTYHHHHHHHPFNLLQLYLVVQLFKFNHTSVLPSTGDTGDGCINMVLDVFHRTRKHIQRYHRRGFLVRGGGFSQLSVHQRRRRRTAVVGDPRPFVAAAAVVVAATTATAATAAAAAAAAARVLFSFVFVKYFIIQFFHENVSIDITSPSMAAF